MGRRTGAATSSTGEDLIEFLNDEIRRGKLPPQMGAEYILACTNILTITHDDRWRAVDVASLNLEEMRNILVKRKGGTMLAHFRERFMPALALFLDHLGVELRPPDSPPEPDLPRKAPDPERPSNPRPRRPPRPAQPPTKPSKVVPMSRTPSLPTSVILPHLFPVREGVLATLCLPSDLTPDEAGRLTRHIESLAIPIRSAADTAELAGTRSPASANGH